MATDRLLTTVSSLIRSEEERKERQETAWLFVSRAKKLILTYGPSEIEEVDGGYKTYKYRSLPCGEAQTPSVGFSGSGVENIYVRLVANVVGNEGEKYGEIRALGINFEGHGESSRFMVELNEKGNITQDSLPTLEDFKDGLLILDQVEEDYSYRKLPRVEEPEDWDHR